MKIADLYIRVSTDEQADKGYSQRDQEERLQKYCQINSIRVRKVVFEDHSAKTFNRPQWTKLLIDLRKYKGQSDLVLFTKWDRFSRNAGDAYQMISVLRKLGVEPQGVEQPLDLSIPENKMMLAFYLAAPEVENDRRALNVFHGMRRAKKEGRCMGPAPVGYVNKVSVAGKKYIAPCEAQGSIMKSAFNELASGQLNTEQVWKNARIKGLRCCKNNFWVAIRNPLYCGKIFVPKYKDEDSLVVQGQHEPLISEALFYDVQDILDGRKKITRTKISVDESILLRGFLLCPKCGKLLTGSASKGRKEYYYYYHCNASCGFRHRADDANKIIVAEIKKYAGGLPELDLFKEIIRSTYNQKTKLQRNEVQQLKTQLDDTNKKMVRARDLLLAGEIGADDYRIIKSESEERTRRLEVMLTSSVVDISNIEPMLEKATANMAHLDILYENGSVAQKRKIVGSIFPEKLTFDGLHYRTTRINEALCVLQMITSKLRGKKNGKSPFSSDLSHEVIRIGFEPMALILEG